MFQGFTIDSASHLIQVALTPIFLLSGIAALLNVYAARLARVSDHLDRLTGDIGDTACTVAQTQQLQELHRRSLALDAAVVLATAAAASTCMAILTLFLFAVSNHMVVTVLLVFFGLAIVGTLGSVAAFGLEMLMNNSVLRRRIRFHLPHLSWLLRPRGK
jgi:hypothetical protein